MDLAAVFMQRLRYECESFSDFSGHVERSIATHLNEMARSARELGAEREQEYFEWHYDELASVRDDYPQLLRRSCIVGVFTLFETRLVDVCRLVKQRRKFKLDVTHVHGQGIDKAKDYLTLAADVEVPTDTSEWARLRSVQALRNCIVHRRGEVGSDKHLRDAVRRVPGATVADDGHLRLDDTALAQLIEDIAAVLDRVSKSAFREQ